MSDRRALALAALALASAFCAAALVARWVYSDAGAYDFLAWNLFLAWIPLVAAVAVYDADRRGARVRRLIPLGALWLLFLPNAPYLLTDLIHLGSRDDAPLWFDVVLFTGFAWTGTLLGFLSLYLMQVVVRRLAGGAWSWALVTNPRPLLSDVWARMVDPLAYPSSFGMTVALTALLSVLYLVLYAFAQLPAAERAPR
jgi:uncharacterized membrane protein